MANYKTSINTKMKRKKIH